MIHGGGTHILVQYASRVDAGAENDRNRCTYDDDFTLLYYNRTLKNNNINNDNNK